MVLKSEESKEFPPGADIAVYLSKTLPKYLCDRLTEKLSQMHSYRVRVGEKLGKDERGEDIIAEDIITIDIERRGRRVLMRPRVTSKDDSGFYGLELDVWMEKWGESEKIMNGSLSSLVASQDIINNRLRELFGNKYYNIIGRLNIMGFQILESAEREGVVTLRARFNKPYEKPSTNRKAFFDGLVRLAMKGTLY
ncbi:hypothetical protein J4447_04375 [Candidatus Pacearchaeota archaeon]|nr:hypothetical protein [Candidatus Pacearchaeota archaeon]